MFSFIQLLIITFLTGSKAPQKVTFIEDLTKILLDNFPDLWNLGQVYFTGKLLKEVKKTTELLAVSNCLVFYSPHFVFIHYIIHQSYCLIKMEYIDMWFDCYDDYDDHNKTMMFITITIITLIVMFNLITIMTTTIMI